MTSLEFYDKAKKIIQVLFIVAVTIFSLKFFDAKFLNQSLLRYGAFFTTWIMVGLSIFHIFKLKGEFSFPVRLIFYSILFSMFMAYYSWGQSFFHSLIETTENMLWPMFFFLLYLNIPIKKLEKIIICFGLLYILLYFYQYINSGTIIFGKSLYGDEFTEERGTVRIIFPGAGIFILTIFIAITKITNGAKNKLFWIAISSLGLLIPVMQVTRQFIVGVFLIYFFHFYKSSGHFKRVIVILFFTVGALIALQSEIPMIQGVIDQGKNDANLGKNYIRVLAGEYYLKDFSPNIWSYIFGNGVPYWGESSYGKFIEALADERGYHLSDVGIIAVYSMFGIVAIMGFFLIWYKSFTLPIKEKYYYVKYYLWYILFTSLTWYSVYHYHYLVATLFALYIYEKALQNEKRERVAKLILKKINEKNLI